MDGAHQPITAARHGTGRRPGRPAGAGANGAATRERVAAAAIELFSTRGFHATGVAELARAADLGAGALYYHIGSKEELLWLVLQAHVSQALAHAEAVAESEREPIDKLRELVRGHVEIISAHRREVAIYVRDGNALQGDRAEELQRLRRDVETTWRKVISEGHQAGAFRTDDPITIAGILGMLNMIYLWKEPGHKHSTAKITERFCDLIIHGLTG